MNSIFAVGFTMCCLFLLLNGGLLGLLVVTANLWCLHDVFWMQAARRARRRP